MRLSKRSFVFNVVMAPAVIAVWYTISMFVMVRETLRGQR